MTDPELSLWLGDIISAMEGRLMSPCMDTLCRKDILLVQWNILPPVIIE